MAPTVAEENVLFIPLSASSLDRRLSRQVIFLGEAGPVQFLQLRIRHGHAKDLRGLVPVPIVPVSHMDAVVVRVRPFWVIGRGRVQGDGPLWGVLTSACGVEPVRMLVLIDVLQSPCSTERLCL